MSRIAKWKLEKTKVKVVFRLQFHATHIPQNGWDKLSVSFIPTDSGKATAKTTKANVRNGTCKWADPIYETTRLLQDVKSKQYDDKLYKFVVAMGSSRSSILGEASINLADYADALKPSAVALPLHGCNSGTVLHVTIQLLTSKTGFREFEQQRELREGGLQMGTDMNRHDRSSFGKISSSEETANDQADKVNARVRFRPESKDLPSLEEEVGLNEEYADSAVGFDGSSNTSGSLYAEKHDTSSIHEIDSLKSTVSGDLNGCSHFESPQAEKGDPSDHRILAQGSNDWVQGWGSDYSMDNDLAIAYEENSRLRGSLEVAESNIFELKQEVSSLQSHADELGVETQKFAQQLASEIASGEELAKEVSVLKSECSKFKDDLQRLQNLKVSSQSSRTESGSTDKDHFFQDIQLRQLHGLLVVEDKIRELHKKAYLGFHERDVRFLHSDLESLLAVLQDLKQGTGGAISLLNSVPLEGQNVNEIRETSFQESKQFGLETGFDVDLYQPEGMPHCLIIPGLVSQNPDSVGATNAMKSKSFELLRELDEVKAEKESLARKMDQMECYYEALIQELEINQKQMLGELQNLRSEHSTCMYTVATNKAEMESMQKDINEQLLRFTEERCGLVSINKELERRAITSEAALRRARLNYSIAVGQLQKDLDLLSFQVLSMFETNENLVKQAFSETSQLCFQGYPDIVQNQKGSSVAELLQDHNQNVRVKKQLLGGDILLEDLKKSLQMQEELYQKVEEELCEMHLVNIHLDVFSKTLQETLLEATADIILMKKKIDELALQLELSAESKELLMLKLQSAMDDFQNLNEDKFSCIAKCNDMVLHNQILEAKLESFSNENCLLTQKVTEYEELMKEFRSYEGKYEACSAEKTELMNLLEKEALKNSNLQLDISSLNGELKTVKDGYDELASLKENLQKTVNFLQGKSAEYEELMKEYRSYEGKYEACSAEKTELMNLLEKETLKNSNLQLEISSLNGELKTLKDGYDELASLKENLQKTVNFLQDKLGSLLASYDMQFNGLSIMSNSVPQDLDFKDFLGVFVQLENIQHNACEKILQLMEEKKNLENEKDIALMSLSTAKSEILVLKQKFKHDIQDMVTKLNMSNAVVGKLQLEVEAIANKLHFSSEAEEKFAKQNKELFSDLALLEVELQQLTSKNGDLAQKILGLDTLTEELGRSRLTISELMQENRDLMLSLQDKTDESVKLASELDRLKECLRSLQHELYAERNIKDNLEGTVAGLTSQLNEKHDQLLHFSRQKTELDHFRQLASALELDKSKTYHLLLQREECLEKLREESSCLADFEFQLLELHELLLASDIEVTFIRTQYETRIKELCQQLQSSDTHLSELHKKHLDVEAMLNCCLAGEVHQFEENARLVTTVESMRSELAASVAQNRVLSDSNSVIMVQLEEYKNMVATLEASSSKDKNQHALEVEHLKYMLVNSEKEIGDLISSKEEMEITVIVLKTKLDEQLACLTSVEDYNDELVMLQNQCKELTHRLSEQILKTEEFKNLSVHLKELKDKADTECLQAREKREPEGPPVAVQESLRIAFIKEQYETKLQELRHQVYISKKHGEEMLLKLQDAIDETENRKKSEASHIKRNEELSVKILELEAELNSVVSDKREKLNAYDRIKAEMECTLLSLECCREEKQKLEASLQECDEEKARIAFELTLTKGQLESSASPTNIQKEENGGSNKVGHMSLEIITTDVTANASTGKQFLKYSDQDNLINYEEVEDASSIPIRDGEHSSAPFNAQHVPDGLISKSIHGISKQDFLDRGALLTNDSKHLAVINDYFKAQSLKSSIDHLHGELERMKNENSLQQDDHHFGPKFEDLQREMMQLNKANEELGSIFPLFNEFSDSGNALERVLALEIELAEALRAKKKSSIHFQSSFVKQHSDEEAVFQSFRDINELIKDMLEIKGRHAAMETELREMHDRYSQLSLQFAEVEGERQKLIMTLKNVRASKKPIIHLNRSSSGTLGDYPSS